MPIQGQANINIGAENEAANSDSLFTAFNKIQNNFTTLFSQSSQYTNFVGSTGIIANSDSANKTVTITNSGVTRLNAGTGIALSSANGNVIISVSGFSNGTLVAGVTNVGIFSSTLKVTNSPIISQGNMVVDLPVIDGLSPGTYQNPLVVIDSYGRILSAQNTYSYGTVTSVAIANGSGLSVSGGPITSAGTITLTNTGVTKVSAGPGILVNQETGEITISANLSQFVGTVSRVTVTSNSLFISNPTITTAGNIAIDLPNSISITGNLTNYGNISTFGSIWANRNFEANGNITANGNIVLSAPSKLRIAGGVNGYILQTDGAGNLSWVLNTQSVATLGAVGSNTQLLFNDGGGVGANSNLTFNKTTGTLTTNFFVGNGNALFNIQGANVTGTVALANVVTATSQPNITSLGNLTGLSVNGNITTANLTATGTINCNIIISSTAANNVSNNQVATTAFVQNLVSNVITGNGYAPINSPVFTGTPQAPTIDISVVGSNALATTKYVKDTIASYAPIASPTFTGTPQAPTILQSALGSNALATTNYVKSAVAAVYANTVLTGIPTAPTASSSTSSNQIATTAFVQSIAGNIDLSTKANIASPVFTGSPQAPTQLQSVANTTIATTAYVKNAIDAFGSGVPLGVIVAWSGTIATIPTGWKLCDGTNGTPDLRDKFIIGARSDANVAGFGDTAVLGISNLAGTDIKTGGNANAVVVSHTHTVNDPGHTHTFRIGQTAGTLSPNIGGWNFAGTFPGTAYNNFNQNANANISINSEGVSGTNQNLPPYYALAYIMNFTIPGGTLPVDLTPYATINNPNFTGIPTGPTAANSTNTTQLATTAFVNNLIASALGNVGGVGVGQTWQNPSRALNTTYTNSTGKPIMVNCSVKAQSGINATVQVGGVTILNSTTIDCCGVAQISYFPFSFIVPNNTTYRINGSYDFRAWSELR